MNDDFVKLDGSGDDERLPVSGNRHSDAAVLRKLFFSFLKIGAFTIGGGYAMIPLIQDEIVSRQKWITEKDFMDLVVVGQTAPGIIAINMAILVGNRVAGKRGAFFSALASAIPSYFIILVIAMFVQELQGNPYFEAAFKAIRPAVVALVAVPVFNMGKSAGLNVKTFWIPVLAAVLICFFGVSPVLVIIAGGLGGAAVTFLRECARRRRENRNDKGRV